MADFEQRISELIEKIVVSADKDKRSTADFILPRIDHIERLFGKIFYFFILTIIFKLLFLTRTNE